LLEQLLAPDADDVWSEFDARYRPVLVGFARRLGLSDSDAEDATQEALTRFVRSYRDGGYDREAGRLRSWMVKIAQNCIIDSQRARGRRREWRGQSALDETPRADELETMWQEECRRTIADRALMELRRDTRFDERTLRAFEMLALGGVAPATVAETLDLSIDSVYAAKSRGTRRLREIVTRLDEAYEHE
jgi:RNA polymerase sigma-70 factor (ECF subfamily)